MFRLVTLPVATVALFAGSAHVLRAMPPIDTRAASQSKPAEFRTVGVQQAFVFAGPSEEFYPTAILKRGAAVEVVYQTGDGWSAVRPPEGSFSWLPATQGFLLPGGRVVEVTDPEAVSWIGSAMGTAKQYRWQVKFQRGQQLAVLGEEKLDDGGRQVLWYKVKPPEGEYRWMQTASLSDRNDSLPTEGDVVTASAETSDGAVTQADFVDAPFEQDVEFEAQTPQGSVALKNRKRVTNPIHGSNAHRTANSASRAPQQNTQSAPQDRWSGWQAMEITDKGVTFPGLARMFGYAPPQTSMSQAASSRPMRSHASGAVAASSRSPTSGNVVSANRSQETPAAENTAMRTRENRGWRDPNDIRQQRLAVQNNAAGSTRMPHDQVILSPVWQDEEVGTGVIPAAAEIPLVGTSPLGSTTLGASSAEWYGIRQAPSDDVSTTMQLTSADLSDVQLKLSAMVAGPERTWNLAPLAERTKFFIEHGATPVERGEARLLLDRIDAFAELQRRSMQSFSGSEFAMNNMPPSGSGVVPASFDAPMENSSVAKLAAPFGLQLGAASSLGTSSPAPRFDATGWLVPVHSQGRDLPTHALTNDAGQAIVYLTPAAGVNLSRYQGQAVGVYGLRGYLPQLKSNHIQVQRVSRLQ
ncbi:MAG: hypothetical protein U0892_06390 [Pirellulales bacterium]